MTSADPSGLFTDLYQLTMAQAYWDAGLGESEAVFHLSFRRNPFGGGFTLAAGIEPAMDFVESFSYSADALDYLSRLTVDSGELLFRADFLEALAAISFRCHIDAVPEGTVVFPREPVLRVRGPLLQAQLFEAGLLSLVNHQSLIATKAARVRLACEDDSILEFGLRRAPEGGLAAARAAYVGGVSATSNVEAGRRWGIPLRGTHSHSWVQAFGNELEAFRAFVDSMPCDAVLLVDTFDTRSGVGNAITVAKELRERGSELSGVRLDSGDLLELSRFTREELDRSGFPKIAIVASGDLDEHRIQALKQAGAPIDVWGVGTRLVTGAPDAALGGVYKLGAIRSAEGQGTDCFKLSDEPRKRSIPGVLGVVRFSCEERWLADGIFDARQEPPAGISCLEWPPEVGWSHTSPALETCELLEPKLRDGRRVSESEPLLRIRERAQSEIGSLAPGIQRLERPALYPVGLEKSLSQRARRSASPPV